MFPRKQTGSSTHYVFKVCGCSEIFLPILAKGDNFYDFLSDSLCPETILERVLLLKTKILIEEPISTHRVDLGNKFIHTRTYSKS